LPPRNVPVADQTISERCPDARSEDVYVTNCGNVRWIRL
jgi:hypothetical protein